MSPPILKDFMPPTAEPGLHQTLSRALVALSIVIGLLATSIAIEVPAAVAVELPPSNQNGLFIQTSGPNAGLNIGDWYTTPVANGGGGTDHMIEITIPDGWPGLAVTVALYDPELAGPDPTSPALLADDEIRNGADTTSYSVVDPSGATIASETYTPTGGTNGAWTELTTFTPPSAGVYELHTTTSDDDDNSWRLSVGYDPDCPTGGCATADLADGDEVDDPDGVPGTADELKVGIQRTSFQHDGTGTICNEFQFFVDGSSSTIALNNFDMDNSGSVTYTLPGGSTSAGTVSANQRWNSSPNSTRVGDVYAINSTRIGWWSAEVCLNSGNQYIFEAVDGEAIFLEDPPPIPELTLTKDDGVTSAASGDELTYTLEYTNVSDLGTDPGQAHDVVLTDSVPTGTTYVSCDLGAGVAGSCTESSGLVTWTIDEPVDPGVTGSVTLTVVTNSSAKGGIVNTAQVRWEDSFANRFAPVQATDTNTLTGADLSVSKVVDNAAPANGADVVFTVTVSNAGDLAATGVAIADQLPAGLTYVSHATADGTFTPATGRWDVGDLAVGTSAALDITANVTADGSITNVAQVVASDQFDPDSTPANGSTTEDDYDTATIVVGSAVRCWLVADNGGSHTTNDLLTFFDGTETLIDGGASSTDGTGTTLVEAIAYQPLTGVLYATNAGELGIIDLATGEYSSVGATGYADVDGLSFDPFTMVLYGAARLGGDDVLFQIDVTTGAAVPGVFGGADFVAIDSTATLGLSDIDDLAISSVDGQMFGIANNGGPDHLIEIDKTTGAVTDVGPTAPASDIEALTFDNLGNLLGTSGAAAELLDFDQSTGAGSNPRALTYIDYEAADCDTNGSNTITGSVFLDKNTDTVFDMSDAGTPGVPIELYRDTNGNGVVDAGEPVVATATTGAGGAYEFRVAATGTFVIAIDETTLPAGSTLTTDDVESAAFGTGFGLSDPGNDFGYTRPTTIDVTKTSDAPSDLEPGDTITYTVAITNAGLSEQTGFSVRDALPDGTSYVAGSTTASYTSVTASESFADDFESGTFDGGTGLWTTDFLEIGESDGSGLGDVAIVGDAGDLALQLRDNDNGGEGVQRGMDLASYDTATLTVDYRRVGLDGNTDYVTFDFSDDGGVTWTEVGRVSGPATDTTYQTLTVDLGSNLTAVSRVRFLTSPGLGQDDVVYIDDIRVEASTTGPITRTNSDTDLNRLTDGSPPALVVADDQVTVASDETLVVSFQVTVDEPSNRASIVNTATASTDQSPPVGDTVINAVTTSTIGDLVWSDTDGDGIRDPGEAGIGGVTVNLLDGSGATVAQTVTAGDGSYLFPGLGSGDFIVEFEAPTGSMFTLANVGGDDSVDSDADATTGRTEVFTLAAGAGDNTRDAGLFAAATIGDFVWDDLDADGIQDPGEPGLVGVTVELLDIDDKVADTTLTTVGGAYGFAVRPGTYRIAVTYPDSYIGSPSDQGGDEATDSDADPATGRTGTVTVSSGDTVTGLDVGAYRPGTIGDFAWDDLNGNGIQDVGEVGLAGVTVTLFDDSGGTVATVVSAIDGSYEFADVAPGDYSVQFVGPGDYRLSRQLRGTDDALDSDPDPATGITSLFSVESGQDVDSIDAGMYLPLLVGDRVFLDIDADGIQESEDRGIEGITVSLLDSAGDVLATTVTAVDGSYGFTDLAPGDYRMKFDVPGFVFVIQNAGTDDELDSDVDAGGLTGVFTLLSGDDDVSVDAGVVPTFIGDLVFDDLNANGIQDDGEPGLDGITVNLLDDAGNLLDSTTTAAGVYQLPVGPGDHIIEFIAPDGAVFTAANLGADDTVDSDADPTTGRSGLVTIADDTSDATVDAGMYTPVTIGDFVFEDQDGDGIQDVGDPGVPNVAVTLIDAFGDTVATTTTSASGAYSFIDVVPGQYRVQFDAPTGTVFTQADLGGDDDLDSDVDPSTGLTALFAVVSGDTLASIDAGVYTPVSVGDFVWVDLDSDGIQDSGEPGNADVTVNLLDGDGSPLDSTTTGADGAYSFTGLPPGRYQVEVVAAGGFTARGAGVDDAVDSDVDPTSGRSVVLTLASGDENFDIDAGLLPPNIGDLVFEDVNGNGVRDSGEPGVAGVAVNLLDGAGTPLRSTTTSSSGLYGFAAAPGQYQIEFVAPNGSTITGRDVGTDDAVDSDADPTTGRTSTFTVTTGTDDVTIDAGIYTPISIGDVVWNDLNGDGLRDAGEPGLPDVTVRLLGGTGAVLATVTTAADGAYEFAGLVPGTYEVEFVTPAGFEFAPTSVGPDDTVDSNADPTTGRTGAVVYSSGDSADTIDAGMYELTTIGDFVWDDLNGNGLQDAGEPGLANVSVELLDAAGDVITTTTTGATGLYEFAGLAPATYRVRFTAPTDYRSSVPNRGADDALDSDADPTTGESPDILIASGTPAPTVDAGYYLPLLVGDFIWVDSNENGVQDAGETGMSGVTVELVSNIGGVVIDTTTSDPDGLYGFTDVTPGVYRIRVVGSSLVFTTIDAGTDDGADSDVDASGLTAAFTLVSGNDDVSVDAGIKPSAIGDLVWDDLDGDGVRDGGEPGIVGVTVNLLDTAGNVLATTTTGAGGIYSFSGLTPGDYKIGFVAPTGFVFSAQDAGIDDAVDSDAALDTGVTGTYTLTSDSSNNTADAGLIELSTIGDFVWVDLDSDGVQDSGEPGRESVVVRLLESGALVDSTSTDADGAYVFTDVMPGTYQVEFVAAGFEFTTVSVGADRAVDSDAAVATGLTASFDVESGDVITDIDAGLEPAIIGDHVFDDLDGDGIQDSGEPGLVGVTVRLLNAAGATLATDLTGASGDYSFAVAPGQYRLEFVTPTGSVITLQDVGTDDAVDSDIDDSAGRTALFTVTDGTDDVSLDAGFYTPATIGDLVWVDDDGSGTFDVGEIGLGGVTVRLVAASGTLVDTTTTAADGSWGFGSVTPGQYRVVVVAPAGYELTTPNVGTDDTIDSDVLPTTGATMLFTLESGDVDDTIDAGLQQPVIIGDVVWVDLDGDEVQDVGEPGLADVIVNLLDADGVEVDSVTTAADGSYVFGAVPGRYRLEFVAPTYTFVTADVGGDDGIDSEPDPATGRTALFTITSGSIDLGFDAGVEPATIGNFMFEDLDGDGIQDPAETGLSGVTVELLDGAGDVVGSTVTGVDGAYEFIVAPGDYRIRATGPVGMTITGADTGVDDALDSDIDPTTGLSPVISIADSDSHDDIDGGFYTLADLGDFVWLDQNRNGLQDVGEPGLAGTTIDLIDAAGDTIDTVVADTAGDYSFVNVVPGDYTLVFTPTSSLTPSSANIGGDDTADSDVDATGRVDVSVVSGTDDLSIDAGFLPPVIGDFVWNDSNGDGIQDVGELGIGGLTVNLLDATGTTVVATTVTSASGYYSFNPAPGTYIVEFVTPTGFVPTQTDQGVDDGADSDIDRATGRTGQITVSDTAGDLSVDAGFVRPATIGDAVWDDLDADGIRDGGEVGLGDVTVNLLVDGAVIATTTSGSDGSYEFGGLVPGVYVVEFVAPTNTVFSPNGAGTDNTIDSDADPTTGRSGNITVTSGGDVDTVDAALYTPAEIGDFVWVDLDSDGIQDADEPGLGGVTVNLVDGVGTADTTTTATDGSYTFAGILPGNYQVEFVAPTDSALTAANAGIDDDIDSDPDPTTGLTANFTLTSGDTLTNIDAGVRPIAIGDFVWTDVDANGVQDVGEPGLDGVVVNLLDGDDGLVATTTTAGGGAYSFAVAPGAYRIEFVAPVGSTFSPQDVGSNELVDSDANPADGRTTTITIGFDAGDDTIDAGLYQAASIGDFIYEDTDGDATQDVDEAGIDGVVVDLYVDDGDGVFEPGTDDTFVATLTTSSGSYDFTGLTPATYWVDVDESTLPAGATLTTANAPALVTVASGDDENNIDVGYDITATVTELIYEDVNGNGVYDPLDDTPLAGVNVTFTDSEGTVQTIATGTDGIATASVAPGTVTLDIVEATVPVGYTISVGTDPTDVVVVAGATASDVTGYRQPGSVVEVVFLDLDGDGVLDAGEALAGVDVVFTVDGVATTVPTDANGVALLSGLVDGSKVTIDIVDGDLPAGSALTVGSDPVEMTVVADSTVTDTTGYQPQGSVTEVVFLDIDGDGVLDAGEALAGVDVVFTVDGVETTIATDANGAATLTGVLAGATVSIDVDDDTLPTGSSVSVGTDPSVVTAVVNSNEMDTTGYELGSEIEIRKSPTNQEVVSGGTVTFTIEVENIGTTDLTDVVVSDPGFAQCNATYATLSVGGVESYTCAVGGIIADFTNTIGVSAVDPVDNTVSSSASAGVVVLVPSFTVAKTPDTQTVTINGDAEFTVTITNTGDVELTDLVIDDPRAVCGKTSIATLAIGAVETITCVTSTVTADFTNTVTVTATDPINNTLSVSDSAEVVIAVPDLTISKGPESQIVVENGTATFEITVENTGAVDLINVSVSDPQAIGCDRVIGALAIGESDAYTCTQSPVTTDYVNRATVTGSDAVGNLVSDTNTASVDMIQPSIRIEKSPDLTYARAGDTITFSITIENTGDAALTDVVVSDPLVPACDSSFATLAIGATESYTCTTTATDDFTNVADVTAVDPTTGTVSDSDDAEVDVVGPAVSITKSPGTQQVIVNGTATFTISVSNVGDSALDDVVVSDPRSPDCDNSIGRLEVTQIVTYTCSLTPVTAPFTNVASVTGVDLSGSDVTASDSAEITTVVGVIEIQKTPDLQTVLSGGTATFEITVTNGGTIALSGVEVSDPLSPDCAQVIGSLAAGASSTYSCTLDNVAGDFTNIATLAAQDAVGNAYSDTDDATVDTIAPSISVTKSPDGQTVVTGGTATFTIEVTNTGDAPLSNVTITDTQVPDCERTITALAVGETVVFTCSIADVVADTTYDVDVVADDPSGGTVGASDSAGVTVLEPSVEIQKSPDLQQIGHGGTATFTITVTNTGQTALAAVTVTDPLVTACDRLLDDLAIGQTKSYTCDVTGIDVDFVNTADVTADDPLGAAWTDSDTAAVDVIDPILAVSKTPDLQTLLAGETASFRITVRNDGDTDLENVVVTDVAAPGCDATFALLASGAVETIDCTVNTVTTDFVNTVSVTADSPLGGTITETDDATVDVVAPGVTIEKTPDAQQVIGGGNAVFSITVANSGDQVLSALFVTDALTPDCNAGPLSLGLGESITYTCTAVGVTADFTNIAAVEGIDFLGNTVSDSDDGAVDVIRPAVSISKTPDLQTVVIDGTATFRIQVTNTGDTELVDAAVTDLSSPDCNAAIGVLAVGETVTIDCERTNVTTDFTNVATVTATDLLGNDLSKSDSGAVQVLTPAVEVQKSPELQLVAVGDDAVFGIAVTNAGETALTDVVVSDLAAPACDRNFPTLAIGETQTYTCVLSTPSADFVNTAVVTAVDPLGRTWTDSDTATVDVIAPALAISKTPDVQSVPLGDNATFSVQVSNTGDVALVDVVIVDAIAPGCATTIAALNAGDTATVTCTLTITGDVTNTASATATDPTGNPVDAGSDTADVTALIPGVLVDKTPNRQAVGVGRDATFTITVTNTGGVDLVSISLVDSGAPDCDAVVGPLAPGESVTYTCDRIDVLRPFSSTVNAEGVDANGNTATSSDSAGVAVLPGRISVTKAAGSATVVAGGDIEYTITVVNNGPADLVDVTITDATLPACDITFASVPAGSTRVRTCTDTAIDGAIADPVVNQVEVTARDEAGTALAATATSSVDVLVPGFAVSKTTSTPTIIQGGAADFTITVANTGETELIDIAVTDAGFPACDRTFATLASGASASYDCSIDDVAADFTNSVSASAVDPLGATLASTSSASVEVVQTGTLTGFVFTDEDGDGIYEPDAGDAPVANVDVIITAADGSVTRAGTGDDGVYTVTLPVGTYTVRVDTADPDFPTAYRQLTTGFDAQTVTVVVGTTVRADMTGFTSIPIATISGTVVSDENRDGERGIDEAGISGVTVTATSSGVDGIAGTADDVTFTTTTDADGDYRFDAVPDGTYTIAVDQSTLSAAQRRQTFDPDGSLDAVTIAIITLGAVVSDLDFGYATNRPPTVATSTVTGRVGQPLTALVISDPDGDTVRVTVVGGSLPDGVALDTDGTFDGTPTRTGTFLVTVEACDDVGACTSSVVEITITSVTTATTTATRDTIPVSGSGALEIARWALALLTFGVFLLMSARRRRRVI